MMVTDSRHSRDRRSTALHQTPQLAIAHTICCHRSIVRMDSATDPDSSTGRRWIGLRGIHGPANPVSTERNGNSASGGEVSQRRSPEGWITSAGLRLGGMLGSAISAVFLPAGYPDSVSPDYLEYQLMDTTQALCSYLRGILATRAVLEGLGVGDASKTVLASTLVWVMKDGVSLLTGLVFSYGAAPRVDLSPKFYRLVADVANDIALTLELCAPSLAIWMASPTENDGTSTIGLDFAFLCCVCTANALKAVCGVSAGCVRVVLTQHFAKQRNAADVNAKEASQETAITLIGILGGSAALGPLDKQPDLIWAAFLALTAIHVWANWRAVSALQLVTLNENRALEAVAQLLPKLDESSLRDSQRHVEIVGSVDAAPLIPDLVRTVNSRDPVWPSAVTSSSHFLAAFAAMTEIAWSAISALGFVVWLPISAMLLVCAQIAVETVPGLQALFVGLSNGLAFHAEATTPALAVPGMRLTRAYTSGMHFESGCHPESALAGLDKEAQRRAAEHLRHHGFVVVTRSVGPSFEDPSAFRCVIGASPSWHSSCFLHRQDMLCASFIECLLWRGLLPVGGLLGEHLALADRDSHAILTSSAVSALATRIAKHLLREWRASASAAGFNPDAVGMAIRDQGWSAEGMEEPVETGSS